MAGHHTHVDATAASADHSFELFPPRDDTAAIKLGVTIDRLAESEPGFFSVTFGAGGSTRRQSLTVLRYILEHTPVPATAHLTAVGKTRAELGDQIREFLDAGLTGFLALRGDPPSDGSESVSEVHSSAELVELIREVAGDTDVHVGVAAFPSGHPRERVRWQDVDALRAKQDAGANFAITQIFFDADEYLQYVRRARDAGVTIPIIPGVAPITRAAQLRRISELNGQAAPAALLAELDAATDPAHAAEIGATWASTLVRDVLAGGAPGVHYFTFNQHQGALRVHDRVRTLTAAPIPTT